MRLNLTLAFLRIPGALFCLVGVVMIAAGCLPQSADLASVNQLTAVSATPTLKPTTALITEEATASNTPAPRASSTLTETAVTTATARPTHTSTPTSSPTVTLAATATTLPTPSNLPPAPRGWRWELYATDIPVTHYITYTYSAADSPDEGEKERPYGLDDQPLPGIEPLPRQFLEQTAYQGAGKLPNGDLLEYAETRPPVKRGLAPFRYVITPHSKCDGHPLAGNMTCSVPFKTGAITYREDDGFLLPVGSTIFVPDLNMKIRINDVAVTEGPHKIDLYTGTLNNYDYERPDGAAIWILVTNDTEAQRQNQPLNNLTDAK